MSGTGGFIRTEVIGDCTLYLGDCRDVLPALGPVSHVITDPPYEELMQSLYATVKLRRKDGGSERKALGFDSIKDLREPFLREVKRVNGGWLLAFCNVEGVAAWREAIEAAGIKFKITCIWNKPDATPKLNGQGPALAYECITTSWAGRGHSRWNGGGRRGVFTHPTNNSDRTGTHPTEKPLSLMRELVGLFTLPGETVLDPFAGSGTTGVACVALGRSFIGVELNPAHFETTCRRIEEAYKQPRLFAEPAPKPVQTNLFTGDAA